MSRRVRESLGSRLVDEIVGRTSGATDWDSIPGDVAATSPDAARVLLDTPRADLWPVDVAVAARWRRCRQVYDFDAALSSALGDTPVGDVPSEAVRLPYEIQYVSADVGGFSGFFAFMDPYDGVDSLGIYLVRDSLERVYVYVPLDGDGDLERSIGYWYEGEGRQLARLAGVPRIGREELLGCVRHAVSLVMYIGSEEADSRVTYAPPSGGRGQRVGRRTCRETVHEVGAVVGRALGADRRACGSGSGGGTHASPAPHVRRAHWQHFWVGPRKGRTDGRHGDELVVRWIPPLAVLGGGGREIVHEARAHEGLG